MSAKPMQDATAIAADLTLTLRADSGYQSTEKHRVSAEQWGVLLKVSNGQLDAKAAAAAPELLGALRICEGNISSLADSHPRVWSGWLSVVQSAIAKAAGEAQ